MALLLVRRGLARRSLTVARLPSARLTAATAFSASYCTSSLSSQFPHTFIHPTAKALLCLCLLDGLPSDNTRVCQTQKIGERCRIAPFAYIGEDVEIGDDTVVGASAMLINCSIGSRVVLHSGVCIGQDGFGFQLAASGDHAKKPQELRVEIHDHVEIGANCTIDRGSWRNTVLGKGCKLDNLIQIGHNVQLGAGCVIAAQTGIAGSTTLGSNVHIGGQVGIAQHLRIGDNVRIAAKSGVMTNLDANTTYGGTPAVPIMEWRRQVVHVKRLGRKAAAPAAHDKDDL